VPSDKDIRRNGTPRATTSGSAPSGCKIGSASTKPAPPTTPETPAAMTNTCQAV